jgi:hypothetical protein
LDFNGDTIIEQTLQSPSQAAPLSKKTRWIGITLSTLVVLFMLLDSVMKLMNVPLVVASFAQLGYPTGIGPVFPQTAVLGAILLTGYLGGAVATHVRVGDPLFSHTLFPVYFGIMAWGGLFFRDERLRALIPLRS